MLYNYKLWRYVGSVFFSRKLRHIIAGKLLNLCTLYFLVMKLNNPPSVHCKPYKKLSAHLETIAHIYPHLDGHTADQTVDLCLKIAANKRRHKKENFHKLWYLIVRVLAKQEHLEESALLKKKWSVAGIPRYCTQLFVILCENRKSMN